MYDKKQTVFKSPDLSKLQAVVIDNRTTIYINSGADPEEARNRYYERLDIKNKVLIGGKKSVAS